MPKETLTDITKTGIQLILEESFYGHFYSHLLKKVDSQIDSMGIGMEDGMPVLLFNPQFWEGLDNPNLKYGQLKHQLLHLALGHPFMRKAYSHKPIFDMAADLVVNQYIQAVRLPEDAITLRNFPHLKLPKGESVSYYYQKILQAQQNHPDAPMPDEDNPHLQQHQNWPQSQQMNPSEQRLAEQMLDEALRQAAERSDMDRLVGQMPGQLLQRIREMLHPGEAQVDWRRMLRIFLGSARQSYIKSTIRRPSKRYGTTPGTKVQARQKVLVGLDTSGSIQPDELLAFFTEINHIRRRGQAEIMVAECDASLQKTYLFTGAYPQEVQGGGGTNFSPIIQWANGHYRPDVLVYFTDGYAPALELACRCPIIWLIAQDGAKPGDEYWERLPGRVVRMS